MTEDDGIAVTDPIVKLDLACGAFGSEIGGDIVDTNGHWRLL
jgi:hypothetical protein